jgi:hypothetical protein
MGGMSQEEIEALMNGVGGSDELSNNEESSTPSPAVDEEVSNKEDIDVSTIIGAEDILNEVVSDSAEEEPSECLSHKIDEGVFPLPVERNHKVVNQLTEVANDSEEKASQIFDVLSFILDENDEMLKKNKRLGDFVIKQTELLKILTGKFPKVTRFKENLELANGLSGISDEIANKVEAENMKLFEAMELMQFNDINRQKIERVMMVIKKLSTYLNNLFEDEDGSIEKLSIAKHLDGDKNDELVGDNLDDLIAEFNKK